VLTLTPGITSYTENGAPVSIDPGALFDNAGTFNGHTLTVSINLVGATAEINSATRLGISKVADSSGIRADSEALYYNDLRIGSSYRTGLGVNAPLELSNFVVTFDSAPATPITAAIIQSIIRRLTYQNTSENLVPTADPIASGQIIVRLTNTSTVISEAQKEIRINGVNDAPTIGRYYQLYDASTGLRPDQIGSAGTTTLEPSTKSWFSYQNSGDYPGGTGTATNTVANGNLTFTTDRPVAAGYSNYKVTLPEISQVLAGGANITTSILNNNNPVLDRTKGYQFSFSGKVLSESRDSGTGVNNSDKNNDGKDDRAGFTVTLIGNDLQGIELQFWTNRIWARTDGLTQVDTSLQPEDSPLDNNRRLFTQSEYVAVNNNDREHQYDISIQGSSYTVYVDGVAQLSGRLRNYTAAINAPVTVQIPFVGSRTIGTPDFYEQPNLIFFGDKNPNAQASVSLSKVSLTTNETFTGSFATRAIVEDSPIVIKDIAIGDAEAQLANVLVTLSGAVGSQIQIATTTGVTIGTNGSRSVTLTGSPSKINAALLAGISYTPPLNATGSQSLEIKINDQGQGGSPLETVKSIAFDISPVADAPILSGNGFINVGQSATLAELFAGKFSDPDLASPAIAGFAITSNPATVAQGSWQYQTAGTTVWTPIGSLTPNQVLTLSASTLIRFTPTVGFTGTPPVLGVKAIDSTLTVANGTIITLTANQLALYSNGQSLVAGRTATALASIVFRTTGGRLNFTGTAANETLYGSKSDDIINGGEGDDWIGGGGCDFLIQLSGRFLWDRDGNDRFDGGAGNDELYGYGGNDELKGGSGDDRLDGGRGNDILIGGTGLDTLVGGFGIDTFTINAIGEGLDTILDFEVGIDLIDLRGIFAGSAFAGTSTFARYQQFVTIVQSGTADSLVNIDSDGLGSGTAQTTLFKLIGVTAASLTSESFIIANTLP
jgi:Ca2+-binding RTX toxin-like protein